MDLGITEEYISRLNDNIEMHTTYLANGSCTSYDDYKRVVGMIKGIRSSIDELHDTLRSMSTDYQDLNEDEADDYDGNASQDQTIQLT